MKPGWQLVFILFYAACSTHNPKLVQSAEADFRITLNFNRELTDAEQDSLEKSLPFYTGVEDNKGAGDHKFYNLLIRKGFISNRELDTTGFNFSVISWEDSVKSFRDVKFELKRYNDRDYLFATKNNDSMKVDLGAGLMGDRFISYSDIDDNGESDVLIMEKYYIMGGYNFDLKLFNFR